MTQGTEVQPAKPQALQPRAVHPSHLLANLAFIITCMLAVIVASDICVLLLSGKGAERRDFISYWAAGQQLAHHQNPYDAGSILRLERSHGFPPQSEALIVRNPPSALLLVAPLGYISFRAAALVWSLLLLSCWLISVRTLKIMQADPQVSFTIFGRSFSPTFVVSLFAPALACIFYGQTALFALLGFVLFLRLYRSHQFWAGVSLWLCALKPHLFLVFAAALLLWIASTRRYRILAGAVVSIGASTVFAYYLDPLAWQQYFQMMRSVGIGREFIPCLSIALRFALSPKSMWLQYLPAAAGCVWAIAYYWRRRNAWDWTGHGPLLVLVSMLLSPYSWLTDQALAFPALMLLAYRVSFRSLLAVALVSSAIEVGILCNLSMHSAFYLWTAPAWLAWYLLAAHEQRQLAASNY